MNCRKCGLPVMDRPTGSYKPLDLHLWPESCVEKVQEVVSQLRAELAAKDAENAMLRAALALIENLGTEHPDRDNTAAMFSIAHEALAHGAGE